ncbi:MAG: hypothetical protein ACJASQ_004151 [Crocinitomicaceae bacterium]|jgi:hypothetical protein
MVEFLPGYIHIHPGPARLEYVVLIYRDKEHILDISHHAIDHMCNIVYITCGDI